MSSLIVLVAPKGAGKDTVFNILKEKNAKYNKVSIAGPLKQICSDVFDIPLNHFNDNDKKDVPFFDDIIPKRLHAGKILQFAGIDSKHLNENYSAFRSDTPRKLLINIGTKLLRNIDNDIHLKMVAKSLLNDKINVITDCRFENEFEFFKTLGAKFIYIFRSSAEIKLIKSDEISEMSILKFRHKVDSIVENNGSLEDLKMSLEGYK